MKIRNKKTGFTLVELMISISIIAILSVVLSISFSRAQKSGRDQRRIEDLKAIQSAAEQMILLSGTYPVSLNSYKITSPAWTAGGQTVLEKFPVDPKYSSTNVGATYTASSIGATGYCVCVHLESGEGNAAGLTTCDFTNKAGYFCVKNQQ